MYNPKISIIIVVYNDKQGFCTTLNSVVALKYSNKEIIVVDGNSTDGTKDIIFENSIHISKWVSEKDSGIYDAMNKGRTMAQGDYLWYVNAGDYVASPYTLDNVFKGVDMEYDIYYGDTLIISEEGSVLGLRKKRLPRHLTWYSFRKGMVVCHQSIIIRKSITQSYDLCYRYSADYKWVLEALRSTDRIRNTKEVLSVFREGGATTRHRKESLKERYQIMCHYFGTFCTLMSHIGFAFDTLKPKYRKFRGSWEL